jgi:hypothetical protein
MVRSRLELAGLASLDLRQASAGDIKNLEDTLLSIAGDARQTFNAKSLQTRYDATPDAPKCTFSSFNHIEQTVADADVNMHFHTFALRVEYRLADNVPRVLQVARQSDSNDIEILGHVVYVVGDAAVYGKTEGCYNSINGPETRPTTLHATYEWKKPLPSFNWERLGGLHLSSLCFGGQLVDPTTGVRDVLQILDAALAEALAASDVREYTTFFERFLEQPTQLYRIEL